jgi:MATE family multidrug resistance protein
MHVVAGGKKKRKLRMRSALGRGLQRWWRRPGGARAVLRIALPLVVQTGFWSVLWFIDRMFLAWYAPQESLPAALPGGMFYWTVLCLPQGIASFVSTFVAQYEGAGQRSQIGRAVQHGIWFGWLTVPAFWAVAALAEGLGHLASDHPGVARQSVQYFQTLCLGGGAVVIAAAQASFFIGRGQTWVVMVVDVFGSLLNMLLDWVLIFGKLGLAPLGIAGAGLATTLANWAVVAAYWLLLRRPHLRAMYGFDQVGWDRPLAGRMLRYGLPAGLPQLIEALGFSLLVAQVASSGALGAAATALAFNINAVAFVPLVGLSMAVATLVGQSLGAGRPQRASRATWTAVQLGVGFAACCAGLYLAVPDQFLRLHELYAAPEEFAPVRDLTVQLLRMVALYCLFDALQIVLVGALRGAGDTRFILLAASSLTTLAIAGGSLGQRLGGWRQSGWALWGWWWVMTLWIMLLAAVYLARFLQGRWRSMRVIEPEPTAPGAQIVPVATSPSEN